MVGAINGVIVVQQEDSIQKEVLHGGQEEYQLTVPQKVKYRFTI